MKPLFSPFCLMGGERVYQIVNGFIFSAMAITYQWHEKFLEVLFSGTLIIQEHLHTLDALVSDPRLDTVRFLLLDFTRLEKVDYSQTDFLIATQYSRTALNILQKQKVYFAYIVDQPALLSHLLQFISSVSVYDRYIERRIFPNRETALLWMHEILDERA